MLTNVSCLGLFIIFTVIPWKKEKKKNLQLRITLEMLLLFFPLFFTSSTHDCVEYAKKTKEEENSPLSHHLSECIFTSIPHWIYIVLNRVVPLSTFKYILFLNILPIQSSRLVLTIYKFSRFFSSDFYYTETKFSFIDFTFRLFDYKNYSAVVFSDIFRVICD